MIFIHDIIMMLCQHNLTILTNPRIISLIYILMFSALFLENGFLPVSFLPGDSLLLLAGALISKGIIDLTFTVIILTIASSLGCWLSYLQGRWLGNTYIVKIWLAQLPHKYYQRAIYIFNQYGILAFLIGRFLAFIRTMLPTIAGISGLSSRRFQLCNWLSALLWVGVMVALGYALNMIPFIKRHEDQVITFLVILPIILLISGMIGTLAVMIKKNIVT